MNEVFEKLEGEISRNIEKLKTLDFGSKEYTDAVESLAKMYRLRLDEIKLVGDNDDRDRRWLQESLNFDKLSEVDLKKMQMELDEKYRNEELELKKSQLEEQKKDLKLRAILELLGLGLPLMFYGIWMKKGFKFEETGTFTSTTFRNFFSKFKPGKK